jgi:hypothetical protein
MRKLEQLNPRARRMAEALLNAFPQFSRHLEVLPQGDFRTHIRAPRGSQAYGLRVCTARGGEDTWIQFGVPNAFYDAESGRDLVKIVRGLLSDRLRFALKEKKGKWTFTTLVQRRGGLVLRRGEVGRVFSWSGAKDETLSPNQPRQPTPVERQACNRESLARRGCAVRSAHVT